MLRVSSNLNESQTKFKLGNDTSVIAVQEAEPKANADWRQRTTETCVLLVKTSANEV